MSSAFDFPKIIFRTWNDCAVFSSSLASLKTHRNARNARCALGGWRTCHKIKQHRAMCRMAAQQQTYHGFSHTVQPWNAALKLPRLRYTCTVLATSRAGRECLYKSSLTNICFFLHHSTASLLLKLGCACIMFAPPSKNTFSITSWRALPPLPCQPCIPIKFLSLVYGIKKAMTLCDVVVRRILRVLPKI